MEATENKLSKYNNELRLKFHQNVNFYCPVRPNWDIIFNNLY